MPQLNGTGPNGAGPMTGRGMGPCGRGNGYGRGFGRGMGCGRGMGYRGYYSPKNEAVALQDEIEMMQNELDALKEEKKALEEEK